MGLFSSDNKAAGGSAEELFEAGDKAYENKDYVKAAQFYKKAAELGHVKAMSFLAYAYRFGEGVKENPEEAFYWYKKTYQSGKKYDAGNIGSMYHYKEISGADNSEIIALLKEGADNGNNSTYIPLIERYFLSKYGCKNSKLAAYWAYRAYNKGELYGSYYLGMCYYYAFFLPEAPAYAKYYLEDFVNRGGDEVHAQEVLSSDELSKVTAVKPVLKLFDDKLPNDFFDCDDPEDLFTEGVELINGFDEDKNSVPQDVDKGIALITMAAEQGYAKAQTVLGLCYEETDKPCPTFSANGSLHIYRSDGKQAVYWLTKAADMGEITAIDEVIYMFKNGIGGAPKNSILVNMYSDMRLKLTGEPFEEYKDEKANGYQELHFEDGDVYKGNIVNNEYHGKGKYIFSDGLVYEGNFSFSKPKGYGKITYPSGETYEGGFDGFDCYDGFGIRKNSNAITRGSWRKGISNGLFSVIYKNGDAYYGGVVNDMYTGLGIYIYADGCISAGIYKNDENLTYKEVFRYKSSFKRVNEGATRYYGQMGSAYINGRLIDCPVGYGERYTNGGYELGLFKNCSLVHGVSFFNNIVLYGDFDEKGNLNGEGEALFICDDGIVGYKGGFLKNLYHGKGIYTAIDGKKYLADWENGMPVGNYALKAWAANGIERRSLSIEDTDLIGIVRNE